MPISVVIPTYKRPELLANAIRSVQEQSVAPAEIIVSDNDPSRSAESVASKTNSVYVGASQTPGASHARNKGESAASSDWIAFLDDDDTWQPNYLEHVTDVANSDENISLVLSWNQIDSDGVVTVGKRPQDAMTVDSILATGNPGITGSNIFVKSSVFRTMSGFDETMLASEDIDFLIRFLLGGFVYKVNSTPDVRHHDHQGDQLSDEGSRSVYEGRITLHKKHGSRISRSARRKLRGRIHLAGFESSSGPVEKSRHLIGSIYCGNRVPLTRLVKSIVLRR